MTVIEQLILYLFAIITITVIIYVIIDTLITISYIIYKLLTKKEIIITKQTKYHIDGSKLRNNIGQILTEIDKLNNIITYLNEYIYKPITNKEQLIIDYYQDINNINTKLQELKQAIKYIDK